MTWPDFSKATGDDLQAAVRDLQEYLPRYWRWVELMDADDFEIDKFHADELLTKMRTVAGIIREFQRRYAEDPNSGWEI